MISSNWLQMSSVSGKPVCSLPFQYDGKLQMMTSDNMDLIAKVREDAATPTLELLPRARYRLPAAGSPSTKDDNKNKDFLCPDAACPVATLLFETGVLVIPEYSSDGKTTVAYVVVNLSDKIACIQQQKQLLPLPPPTTTTTAATTTTSHFESQEDQSTDQALL